MKASAEYFNNMTKEELMKFLEDCGIEVESVNEGEGGFFVDGERIER